MRNITVTVEDQLHSRARVRAAELETSVSAVVREFLTGFAGEETEYDRRKRLERETLATIQRFKASDRIPRDEVHERHALR
jgi:plasmid stability protein